MILLPAEDSKRNYLTGFWQWVELMANDEYEAAFAAIRWPEGGWSDDVLRSRVTSFFGGDEPWSVVVPNARLIDEIERAAEWQPPTDGSAQGWLLAMVPLTTRPEAPSADDIPLMGLAMSFFIVRDGDACVLEFEILHA